MDRQTGSKDRLHTFGVSFDGAGETEELNQPTMIPHQRFDESTCQDLGDRQAERETARQTERERQGGRKNMSNGNDDDDDEQAEDVSHRQNILHGDDKHVVANQTVPVHQNGFDWFEQQVSAHQQEVETGHQVTHTEDTDPGPEKSSTILFWILDFEKMIQVSVAPPTHLVVPVMKMMVRTNQNM